MTLAEEIEYGFAAELASEVSGRSRRRWALLLVAFVAGVLATLYMRRRRSSAHVGTTSTAGTDAAAAESA